MGREEAGYLELRGEDTESAHSLDLDRGVRRVNRKRVFAWVGAFVLLFTVIFIFREPAQEGARNIAQIIPSFSTADPKVRIVFTETKGVHDEVLTAWKEAWGGMPSAEMQTFQWRKDRYGSEALRESLPIVAAVDNSSMWTNQTSAWSKVNAPPDILVITTCEYFPFWLIERLLNSSTTHVYCTAHHADQWVAHQFHLEALVTPWLLADRLTFITLSEHVGHSVLEYLKKWKVVQDGLVQPRMQVLPPVFTVPQSPQQLSDRDVAFAIQGYFNVNRRDYGAMFSALARAKQHIQESYLGDEEDMPQVRLHLVGHSDSQLKVPAEIKENVIFNEDLPYLEFYSLLSEMTALVPAFSNNDYLTTKASSSVPASLIAGIPIVASPQMLKSYSYLDPEAVWQQEGESDVEVMVDIVKQSPEARRERREMSRAAARQTIKNNQLAVREWALEILEQAPVVRAEMEAEGRWDGWEEGVAWWKAGFPHSPNW